MLEHYTYVHKKDKELLKSVGLKWECLATQCFHAEDHKNTKKDGDERRRNRNIKANRKLADMARGIYKGMKEAHEEIEKMTKAKLIETCKTLTTVNRQLLKEKG